MIRFHRQEVPPWQPEKFLVTVRRVNVGFIYAARSCTEVRGGNGRTEATLTYVAFDGWRAQMLDGSSPAWEFGCQRVYRSKMSAACALSECAARRRSP